MADNALHLNDEDKQALAVSIADIGAPYSKD